MSLSLTKIFLYFVYTEIYFLLYGFQTQVFVEDLFIVIYR